MRRLGIGVRVRYIGQSWPMSNVLNLLLVGHAGVIRSRSTRDGFDWFVVMDEGCFDLDAKSEALVPLDEQSAPQLEMREVVKA